MSILSRFFNVFRTSSLEREFEEELRFHLDRSIERNLEQGMSRDEAEASTYLRFGKLLDAKQGMYEARVMKKHLALSVMGALSVCVTLSGFFWFQHSSPDSTGAARATDASAPIPPSVQEAAPVTAVVEPPSPAAGPALSIDMPRPAIRRVALTQSGQSEERISPSSGDTPSTTMVEVDGFPMRVRTAGFATRRPDQPVVIFESNLGVPLELWNYVLPEVATFAPVMAYDRAGTGRSEWDSIPPTPEHVLARLRQLLTTLNVAPPYLLVGHGWGGALVRYFGGSAPDDMAGLVYIDPIDLTQTPAEEIALFESIGEGVDAREALYDAMERIVQYQSPGIRADQAVALSLMHGDLPNRRLPAAPDIPTTVILSDLRATDPAADAIWHLPFDGARYLDAMQRTRLQRMPGWIHEPGQFLVAAISHNPQWSQPDVVIQAIRHLVQP